MDTTQLTFMLAEHTNYRQRLENQLTQDSIFIMLITYPFLGLLIWVIVGVARRSVKLYGIRTSRDLLIDKLSLDGRIC